MVDDTGIETWRVDFSSKADKQAQKLLPDIRDRLNALPLTLAIRGRNSQAGEIKDLLWERKMFTPAI